jgi:hypothetical protein
MEGGIGIFLLLIVLVVVVVGGIALYITGGGILASSKGESGDEPRPLHKDPSKGDPVQQHTHFVGTGDDERS